MNEINKTLYIPLYGKAAVSRKGVILRDPDAEKIWASEAFPVKGKSASRWLAYNMAMRARVFDDWTEKMLALERDALVLHIGCGLDSRCRRVTGPRSGWIDADLPEVIACRQRYYSEDEGYRMLSLDAADPEQLRRLPESPAAVAVLEGLSMYLTNAQLRALLGTLGEKYPRLHVLMDVYTLFSARASRWKNPVNDVGVTRLYGVGDINALVQDLPLRVKAEHSFTPARLVNELSGAERILFQMLFTGRIYGRIYRLFELESIQKTV